MLTRWQGSSEDGGPWIFPPVSSLNRLREGLGWWWSLRRGYKGDIGWVLGGRMAMFVCL